MTFDIYNQQTGVWVDVTQYISFQGLEGSRNDVDGPNAGRVIADAKMHRSRVATKYKWNLTSKPITESEARTLEALLMPEYISVRTDYYSASPKVYECYSNNVTKTYLINRDSGEGLVKVSAPIVER